MFLIKSPNISYLTPLNTLCHIHSCLNQENQKLGFILLEKKKIKIECEEGIAFIIVTTSPTEVYDNIYPCAAGIF